MDTMYLCLLVDEQTLLFFQCRNKIFYKHFENILLLFLTSYNSVQFTKRPHLYDIC